MHPNPLFRKAPRDQNIAFARERSFGILSANAEGGPLISHIPFQLSEDGSYLEAHLVRSNPILQLLADPVAAVIAVSGGDCYVSPDWYGIDNQVPTWNYVAVHLRGLLRLLPDEELLGVLDRLSANMESRLAPKKPWTTAKMDDDILSRMTRQIVPVAMDVSEINGTWKLSQNKEPAAIEGARSGVSDTPVGSETAGIVRLMAAAKDQ